jgi:4-hydroxy-4-methyl-2-oxoglutarate aldolase
MNTAKLSKSNDDLFALAQRELFTWVVGDVMDTLELQHRFHPQPIQPLRQDMLPS